MASTSFLGLPETRLGIIPGAGGTFRLPMLIGKTRAADMILTGRQIGAEEALRMGLCDRIVEVESDPVETDGVKSRAKDLVHAAAYDMARTICTGGPLAVNQALNAIKTGEENIAYDVVLQSQDRLEALAAFAEKRKPNFKGE
jgi:methylglutaconyl-CoA hydratase